MKPTGLKLRFYGEDCLRRPAKIVQSVGPAERLLIKEMIAAMREFEGSGLSANQVGIEERIAVLDAGDGPFAVVNPEILKKSGEETAMDEGCLSIPKVRVQVRRSSEIRVRYLDEQNRKVEKDLAGLPAKIFQHEFDHLQGRMIIDYASQAEKDKFQNQLAALEELRSKPSNPKKLK